MNERLDNTNLLPGSEVQRELVRLHARMMMAMPWVHIPLIVVMAITCLPQVPLHIFATWAAAMMGIEWIRRCHGNRILQRAQFLSPSRAHSCQTVLAALSGLTLGCVAPLFLPKLQILDQAWLFGLLVAVPALGVAVSMASRYIAGVYALGVLGPLVVGWSAIYPEHTTRACIASLLYLGVLVFSAMENQRSLSRSVAIRRERDQVVHDLERSNAEVQSAVARAEQEAAARAHVLAAASHDLRQPLHALSIYSAILAANPSQTTLREVSGHMDQLVKSLGEMLHGLLDLSRLASGHYVPQLQRFDLSKVIQDIADEFTPIAVAKGIALQRTIAPVILSGDALAVSRIVRNLLDNAVKYTDAGGAVQLTLRCKGPMAAIGISDTGRGIARADQSRIFDEFYQVGNAARNRRQGVGLGLAIVHRLTQLIDATLTLDSTPGVGSRFELDVPGVTESLPPVELAPTPLPHTSQSLRVYLVDDDEAIRRSMASLLTLWHCAVSTAADGREAEALCEAGGPPALMVIDLRLPGSEDGSQLTRRLQERYGSFGVLVITGETSSLALQAARTAGWPVLQKPVDVALLRDAIDRALSSRVEAGVSA